uniref:(northern house mosquito) hypothetical protein n=1 Tax=Culex pipiens TaxID=7175 RepID=A0A8D8BJX1_CULPI
MKPLLSFAGTLNFLAGGVAETPLFPLPAPSVEAPCCCWGCDCGCCFEFSARNPSSSSIFGTTTLLLFVSALPEGRSSSLRPASLPAVATLALSLALSRVV